MSLHDMLRSFDNRLEEAQLYIEQGLSEGAMELLESVSNDLEDTGLPEEDKISLRSRIAVMKDRIGNSGGGKPDAITVEDPKQGDSSGVIGSFEYGKVLMDGQFFEEAIEEFKKAAIAGDHAPACWELCGDCAHRLDRWEEAIRYYEIVYTYPNSPEELKYRVLRKLTRCSQNFRKTGFKEASSRRLRAGSVGGQPERVPEVGKEESSPHPIRSVEDSSVHQLVGKRIFSWQDSQGRYLAGEKHSYRVLNLLHVGMTSLVVELEREDSKERFTGQTLNAPYRNGLSPEMLSNWVQRVQILRSPYVARVHDLAHRDRTWLIVREYLPWSLAHLIAEGEPLPISTAVFIAYRVSEGLGDLHLHMEEDDQIGCLYHLDLRPSRILLYPEKAAVKMINPGLWELLLRSKSPAADIRRLPLSFLAYRAPEQFRPYLARRKPPVFTDIYQFGTLFYEILTGVQAFQASSFEEYEIQHCDQYPTPPKVWRTDIPEDINDMIMKCLERDPMKRWRNATQLSLIFEKSFGDFIQASANPLGTFMRDRNSR